MNYFIAGLTIFGLALVVGVSSGQAGDMPTPFEKEAVAHVRDFTTALGGRLKQAMKDGGPVQAIGACNLDAPKIAAMQSKDGWTVGRTALKVRNNENIPNDWQLKVLQDFETRRSAGVDISALSYSDEIVESGQTTQRFMKAIPTKELCLTCHGKQIDGEVAAKLDSLYPSDQARGFEQGDIRGAFVLTKSQN